MEENIKRRSFLKELSAGTLASSLLLSGCSTADENKAIAKREKGAMEKRINPNSGDSVSLLGYGCMRWPTIDGERNNPLDQDAVNQLVDHAIANGINYFDAAPVYCKGECEKVTGIALSRHPRESYFIATKMSNFSDMSREGSINMYRNSLKYFNTDYLDYYLLHSLGNSKSSFNKRFIDNGVLDFLVEERKKGHIRNLGFSFHGTGEAFDYYLSLHDKYHWDFVQIQMNYADWRNAAGRNCNAEYLYNELDKRGIPVVIMEPLLGGRLAKMVQPLVERLKSQRPDMSVASWAFRFVGSYPRVLTALSGMTYVEHLNDNINTYSPLEPCTQEELEMLESVAKAMLTYPTIPCNSCQYCMPCPYGIDIVSIFNYYNKCVNEGNVAYSSSDDNYRKARRKFLIGYDRAVDDLRQAKMCISCGECTSHCPQNIKIPFELGKIDKYVEMLKQGLEF